MSETTEIDFSKMSNYDTGFHMACFILTHGDLDDFAGMMKKELSTLTKNYIARPYERTVIERDSDKQITGARKETVIPLMASIERLTGIANGAAVMAHAATKQTMVYEIAHKIKEITFALDQEPKTNQEIAA